MELRRIMKGLFPLLFGACMQEKAPNAYPSVPDYDITNPTMIHLKTELDEISGIAFYPKDTSIFAINDELGILYKIYVRKQVQVQKWKFASDGDYEDLVFIDSTFYALQSNGSIKSFRFFSKDSLQVDNHNLPSSGHNEFEAMYYDAFNEKIGLICKDCQQDSKKAITVFGFSPQDETFSDQPFFTINAERIAELLGKDKVKFKPSAAAIHPVTKELYIISSVNKAIAITDREGKIKQVYRIDPRLFKQPEGITFTPSGDMLISNESADIGAPNILIFKYKPAVHEKS